MKTVYHVYDEEEGEVEGMFDEKGKLIDTWCCNDASWRGEYFDGFMTWAGIKIIDDLHHRDPKLEEKLKKQLRKRWK
jgi:hypothetical protein